LCLMKKYFIAILLMLFSVFAPALTAKAAVTSPPPLTAPSSLSLIEIKITGNEFIMLQNNTSLTIPDLSRFWLYDFNNTNPLASGVSSSTQQLPAAALATGQTIMLSANGGSTCGAAVTAKLSISLTDSGGFLEVVQTSMNGNTLTQTAGDAVSWSSGVNTAPGMIASVPSSSADPAGAYYRYQNPDSSALAQYLWQLADLDTNTSCQLNVKISGSFVPGPSNPGNQLLPGDLPPATFVSAPDSNTSSSTSTIPASDIGLAAPQISELLPNPAEPQTDSEDEFVELYNSNNTSFDLSGFKIEVGSSTKHDYTFPDGTIIPAKSFKAFFSEDTGLSLSNSGGQAWLLDPANNIISQTDPYGTAKDGQTWALGPDGKWYWTMTATPNAPNIVLLPSTASTKSSTGSKSSTPKTTSTKAVKAASTTSKKTSTSSASTDPQATSSSKMHLWILAVIGTGAVLYAVYEYRNDLANLLYRVRRYRETRRATGESS
jgi:hypothetical protein